MSKNINQIAVSAGSVLATDKFYLGRSPFGLTDDRYLLGSDLIAQFTYISPLTTKGDLFTFTTVDARLPVGTVNGQVLQVASGAATGLAWSTPSYPSSSGSAGKLIRSDGTNNVYTTLTFPDTIAQNVILFGNIANNLGPITPAASAVLVSDVSNVPSWSTTLPAGLTIPGYLTTTLASANIFVGSNLNVATAVPMSGDVHIDNVGATTIQTTVVTNAKLATAANLTVKSNISGGVASPSDNSLTAIIDAAIGTVQGDILYRNATVWTVLAPGSAGQVLQTGGAAANPAYSVPTYPAASGTLNHYLVSDGTNNVYSANALALLGDITTGGAVTFSGAFTFTGIITGNTSVTFPTSGTLATTSQLLASPLTTKGDLWGFSTVNTRQPVGTSDGQILQVNSAAATGLAYSTATYPTTATSTGSFLYANGTNYVASTSLWPNTVGTSGLFIISNGTSNVYSTSTIPTSAGATANKVLVSDGTNYVLSTPTFPNASATSGKIMQSDGTNWIASSATWPTAAGNGKFVIGNGTNYVESTSTIPTSAGATANKVLLSDGTNYVLSTPTFPNASATTRKIIVSDGTNWVASTETYAVPGTSGNVLTSNGTNWTSAVAPTGKSFSVVVQRVTTTGAGTYTPTSGMVNVIVRAQAAGGGGGGAATSGASSWAAGKGGGGGEYIEALFTAANIGASKAFSVGAKGTGGTAGANNGTGGGNTTFNTTWIIATGGGGGNGGTSNAVTTLLFVTTPQNAATGGSVATGTLMEQIGGGDCGMSFAGSASGQGISPAGGDAGSGYQGAKGVVVNSGTSQAGGNADTNSGAGGSGAMTGNATQAAGGNGGDGWIEFIEFVYA